LFYIQQTTKNYLHFYDVMSDKNHIYQYNFSTRHEYYNEENTGVPKTRIVYKFFTEIDEDIKWLLFIHFICYYQ